MRGFGRGFQRSEDPLNELCAMSGGLNEWYCLVMRVSSEIEEKCEENERKGWL